MARPKVPPSYVGGRLVILLLTIAILAGTGLAATTSGTLRGLAHVAALVAWSARDLLWPW